MPVDVEWTPGRFVPVDLLGEEGPVVLLAPGAGTSRAALTDLAGALAVRRLRVATFDYPYRVEGRRVPDRLPVLSAAHRAVADRVAAETGEHPILGGRSMGGRVATLLAADGYPCRGVVCLSYPLHPVGRPDELRVDHLGSIRVPLLFIRGSRDAMSRRDLFDRWVRADPRVEVFDLPGGDHSLRVPGRSPVEVVEEVASAIAGWVGSLP